MDKPLTQKEIKTIEQALEAVKNFGGALKFVPEALKTPELCIEAVKSENQREKIAESYSPTPEGFKYVNQNLKFVPETIRKEVENAAKI